MASHLLSIPAEMIGRYPFYCYPPNIRCACSTQSFGTDEREVHRGGSDIEREAGGVPRRVGGSGIGSFALPRTRQSQRPSVGGDASLEIASLTAIIREDL